MKKHGLDHDKITKSQRRQFDQLAKDVKAKIRTNDIVEHTKIARQALIDGGASPSLADKLTQQSVVSLVKQNVTSPSHIPWN